jgi:hypothetical protein
MESVAKLGIGKPELETLTKLFNVCLESALQLEDEEDFSEDGFTANAFDSDEDGEDASTLTDKTTYGYDDEDEYEENDAYIEPKYTKDIVSTIGTNLAKSYLQFAPKLLHTGKCEHKDVSNLATFIDWLIRKFKSFDPTNYMEQVAYQYNSNQSYDTDRMDKTLNVIDVGEKVTQLLEEINNKFRTELEHATLINESSVFTVAKDINEFVSDKFHSAENEVNNEQEDQNIVYNAGGFINRDNENTETLREDQYRMAADNNVMDDYGKNTKNNSPSAFSDNEYIDTVDTAVNDFLDFVPTIGLSDKEASIFNKSSDKNNKLMAKNKIAQRAAYTKAHKGDVLEASSLNDDDNPWDDL